MSRPSDREAFERWMLDVRKCVVGSADPYPAGIERDAWQAWQAGAANARAAELDASGPQGTEPVAWGAWSEGDPTRLMRYDGQPAVSHSRSDFYNVPLYTRPPV